MKTIAFGPVRDKKPGSWFWFKELMDELSKYYKIKYVTFGEKYKANITFILKHKRFLEEKLSEKKKVLYCPVDAFELEEQVITCREDTRIHTIVLSSDRLRKYFCNRTNVHLIHHQAKFIVDVPYNEFGHIIWVGGEKNWPIVRNYIGDRFLITKLSLQWTKEKQIQLFKNARSAIDIKAIQLFKEYYKPITKAVDYLASGIPFACNGGHPAKEFFEKYYDLYIPSPITNFDYWNSKEYWEKIQKIKPVIREDFSLQNIGWQYKKVIDDAIKN